jgi:hypothetical protein
LLSFNDVWLKAQYLLTKIIITWPGSNFKVFLLYFLIFGFAYGFLEFLFLFFLLPSVSSNFFRIFKFVASTFIELNYIFAPIIFPFKIGNKIEDV